MSKLIAYRLSGSTFDWNDGTTTSWIKILGVELDTYDHSTLNGNDPYKIIDDNASIPQYYTDISNIFNWANFGTSIFEYSQIRKELHEIKLPLSACTESEIEILNYYGLIDYFLIYDFAKVSYPFNAKVAPMEVDYDLNGLYKKRYFSKGELMVVEYYGSFNANTMTYSNLVVKEDRIYYRVNQMVNRREMQIHWYLDDGKTIGYTKNTMKYYTLQEGIQAGEQRRANVVSDLKITVVGLIMAASGATSIAAQSAGRPFINTYTMEIAQYVQGFESELKNAILNDTVYSWMNLPIPGTGGITIRQYLISELTIDYNINNVNIL